MDVGQVQFSVTADNLKDVLKMAQELEDTLNRIDKKTVGAKAGSVAKSATNATNAATKATNASTKATKAAAKEEKEYAQVYHKASEGRIKEAINTGKRTQKVQNEVKKNGHKLFKELTKEADTAEKSYQDNLHKEFKESSKQYGERIKQINKESKLKSAVQKEELKNQKLLAKGDEQLTKRYRDEFDAYTDKEVKKLMERPTMYDAAQKLGETQAQVLIDRAKAMEKFRLNWETNQAKFGAQMQTLGTTMQKITSPFENVYKGLTMGIGYRLMYKMMDSIQGAFSRYDTMKTYGIVLKELGMDASKKFVVGTGQAKTALDNLNDSVLGLPTGLDEIVASMKVYAGMTNDIEKATKVAIAANNAFLAGGTDQTRQRMAEKQLQNLLSNGELTPQQWNSLQKNMAVGFNAIGKELGYSDKNINKFLADMKSGKHTVDEFINAFIKVGTEGSIANAANAMKQTWQGLFQNIQNAIARAGEGILDTLNEVFTAMDGRNFLQHALGIDKNGKYIGGGVRGAIDNMAESAKKWIKANPKAITNFFNNLSKINFASIASGFAKFALSMGRVYAFLGRIAGNGNLVRFMLDLNLAGKAIQMGGGLLKGTAKISAWFATLLHFKGATKIAKVAGKIYKSGGAIVGATRTIGQVALTWQDVASKGLSIAAIPAMAWSLKEVALALQEFSKVKFSAGLVWNIQVAAGAITEFVGLASVLGGLMASSKVGWLTSAGTFVGGTAMAGIAKTMKWIGEGLNAIAEAKLPESGKISSVMKKMDEISRHFKSVNIFESIGKIFDTWTKSSEFKAVKNATDAFKGIADMVNLKLPKKWKTKSKDRFDKVIDFVTDIENMVVGLNERLMERAEKAKGKWAGSKKGTSKAEVQGNAYAYIKEQLREFADNMQSISDGLGYLDTALMSTKKFNKDYSKLNKLKDGTILPFDWDAVYYRIKNFADQIYKFATRGEGEDMSPFERMKKAAEQLKDANFEQISSLFTTLPKIITGMEATYKKMQSSVLFNTTGESRRSPNGGAFGSLTSKLDPLFKAIGELNTKIPENIDGLKRLKSIQTAIGRVPGIINQIVNVMNNTQVGQINVATIQGIVAKIKEALGAFDELKGKTVDLDIKINGTITDNATDKINDAYKSIKTASDKIEKLSGTKTVKIHVNAVITGVTAAVQAINDAIAKIRDAISRLGSAKAGAYSAGRAPDNPGGHPVHTGGKIQYRAHGGEIYKTRGTDSVPAMLTPGEWVINRRSSSLLGDNVLWKLNHMDIRGAINALSSRFGAPSSIVNNTYNRNIGGITLNNGNSASVGLERTSKWVKGL